MLAVLITWIVASFVFFSFGKILLALYSKITKTEECYTLVDTLLIGMCFTATIIAICSLFVPANIFLLIGLMLISIIYWGINSKELLYLYGQIKVSLASLNVWQLILVCSPVIIFLIHSVTAPLWVDTPYYHVQNIMWNEQYHVVPGLANLQPRFGFNSNYYLLCSVFGLKPLFGQYIFGVQQLCYVAIFTWIVYRSVKGLSIAKTFASLFIIAAFVVVYKLHFTSPSSDFLPNLLIAYLFIRIIVDDKSMMQSPLLFVCLPVFCLTLKLSAFLIGIFTLIVFYNCIRNKQFKTLLFFILLALVLVVPWMVRTIIITGYLVYPYPSIDIFTFDWKVPVAYVQDQKDYIMAFARVDGYPIEEILPLSIADWVPRWWQSGMFYYNSIANRLFAILILFSAPVMSCLFIASSKIRRTYSTLFLIWLIAFIAVIFWFLSAPDFRFAYGFILPFCIIPFYLFIDILLRKCPVNVNRQNSLNLIVVVFTILFVALQAIRWSYYQRDTTTSILTLLYKPQTLDYTKKLKEEKFGGEIVFVRHNINNVDIYSPNFETHCYDCPLPCGSDYTGGIEMRGKTLQDGFRSFADAPYRRTY